jgi:hypothetical protein
VRRLNAVGVVLNSHDDLPGEVTICWPRSAPACSAKLDVKFTQRLRCL